MSLPPGPCCLGGQPNNYLSDDPFLAVEGEGRCAVKWVTHLQRSTDAAAEVGAIRAGEYAMDGQVFWWAVYGLGCLNRLGVHL